MANSQTVMLVIRSARPSFRNYRDNVAFVVHASFVTSGFRLVAIGRPAFAEDALASSPTQGEVGIEGWNEFDEYAFVYEKGSKKFLVKCLEIEDKLLVDAVAEGGSGTEPAHLEIEVEKYAAESGVEGDYDAQFKNLGDLVTDLQNQILYKLDEGLKPVASTSKASSESNKESEPGYYGRRPVPSGPPVIGRFGDGSMLVGPNDTRMFPGFGDHPGFMKPHNRVFHLLVFGMIHLHILAQIVAHVLSQARSEGPLQGGQRMFILIFSIFASALVQIICSLKESHLKKEAQENVVLIIQSTYLLCF
ncbi:hypothetical protein Bca52824_000227 [Brassica carinata]|uniref:PI31 proteasome regulator N-terminal domain-containing protein n=1 Tax=Brassica carinata TaxID=52824 RepID=A0A8X8BBZ6_BRACI|nr:hypothetical protein Bca52824_000227 [Brassica carinata]